MVDTLLDMVADSPYPFFLRHTVIFTENELKSITYSRINNFAMELPEKVSFRNLTLGRDGKGNTLII